MTPHTIGQEPKDANGVLIDHERRLGSMESKFEILSLQVQSSLSSLDELKGIVVQGNKDSMEFFKEIIGHEHGMEKVKVDFKQHMQQMELEMKQKQMDAEEKLKIDREKWNREQKEQNKQMRTDVMRKVFLIFAPVATVIVSIINYWLQSFIGGPPA